MEALVINDLSLPSNRILLEADKISLEFFGVNRVTIKPFKPHRTIRTNNYYFAFLRFCWNAKLKDIGFSSVDVVHLNCKEHVRINHKEHFNVDDIDTFTTTEFDQELFNLYMDIINVEIMIDIFDIFTLRVGKVVAWYPKHVRVSLYTMLVVSCKRSLSRSGTSLSSRTRYTP